MNNKKVLIKKSHEGQTLTTGGNAYRVIVNAKETNKKYSIVETIVRPGSGGKHHVHSHEDEVFIIKTGIMTFYEGSLGHDCPAGTIINCPLGSTRAFRNETDSPVTMLIFYTPGGIEEMMLKGGDLKSEPLEEIEISKNESVECPRLNNEYGVEETLEKLPKL
jgi:mannose-6-phosphate isomerase-like protein (cupin superfamily)